MPGRTRIFTVSVGGDCPVGLTAGVGRLRWEWREALGPREESPRARFRPASLEKTMAHPFHGRCAPRGVPTHPRDYFWRGPGGRPWAGPGDEMEDPDFGGLGVRRPLRFLAHRLDLDERQVAEMARILHELKTERAQAEVDRRRTLSTFADALTGDTFDAAKAAEAGALRVTSATRVGEAVLKALRQIHAVLNSDQRVRLAYLIRTGTLTV